MKPNKSAISDIDPFLIMPAVLLSVIGILFIYSSGMSAEGILFSNEYVKQIVWFSLSLALLAFFSVFDYSRVKDYTPYVFAGFCAILVYTRLFGRVVNGSRSWVGIGSFGLQPSEFMKIAAILFLARFLSNSEHSERPFRRFLKAGAIILVPMGLILLQPDFGTALVFFPIFMAMIYVAGIERRYIAFTFLFASLASIFTILPLWEKYILKSDLPVLALFTQSPYVFLTLGLCALILALAISGLLFFKKRYYYWISFFSLIVTLSIAAGFLASRILKEYQIMRLIVFLDPKIDPKGSGWNIIQSVTAIGSGGLFGKGFLAGTQSHYRYLPQQSTDFIFSIISEEWGFLGGAAIFGLFLLIFLRGVKTIENTRDMFGKCIVAGVTMMIFFHFVINVGMAMGIMPITGIPLFFLSYGGSSLWTAMIGIGLILSVYRKRYSY